jgi:hypothetical protein
MVSASVRVLTPPPADGNDPSGCYAATVSRGVRVRVS